jgi:hypothetical protein
MNLVGSASCSGPLPKEPSDEGQYCEIYAPDKTAVGPSCTRDGPHGGNDSSKEGRLGSVPANKEQCP